jgi:hypothetical protein
MNKSMPVWAGWLMLAVIVEISLLTSFTTGADESPVVCRCP